MLTGKRLLDKGRRQLRRRYGPCGLLPVWQGEQVRSWQKRSACPRHRNSVRGSPPTWCPVDVSFGQAPPRPPEMSPRGKTAASAAPALCHQYFVRIGEYVQVKVGVCAGSPAVGGSYDRSMSEDLTGSGSRADKGIGPWVGWLALGDKKTLRASTARHRATNSSAFARSPSPSHGQGFQSDAALPSEPTC